MVTAVLILYVMLAPEPPHWGTLTHLTGDPATPASLAPPPGWTSEEEGAAGHAALFALLGVFVALWYATSIGARRSPRRTLLMVMAALWLFGGLTELAQGLTPTRAPELSDLGFDVLGAFVGFLGGGFAWRLLLTRLVRPSHSTKR